MKIRSWATIVLTMFGLLALIGCTGGSSRVTTAETLPYARNIESGLRKTVVLELISASQTAHAKQSARHLKQSLAKRIRAKDTRLRVLTTDDHKDVADVVDALTRDNITVASEGWRRRGYQAVIIVNLLDLRPVAKRTGMMWFRKMSYFIDFEATLDLFDPHNGVKLVSEVAEVSFDIDEKDYQQLNSGEVLQIDALDDRLNELAADYSQKAFDALDANPWQTSVIYTDAQQVKLAAGQQAGLSVGDRFAIYRGNKTIEGLDGTFILPGEKLTEITIQSVTESQAEATAQDSVMVQIGDIAVPLQSK